MLTIIGLALVILVVVGMVKIYRQKEQIRELQDFINVVQNNIDQSIEKLEDTMGRNIDEIRREYSSYVDSRFDKLMSKINDK
jgi:predicted Holliday junction resolvase-like endonuclease